MSELYLFGSGVEAQTHDAVTSYEALSALLSEIDAYTQPQRSSTAEWIAEYLQRPNEASCIELALMALVMCRERVGCVTAAQILRRKFDKFPSFQGGNCQVNWIGLAAEVIHHYVEHSLSRGPNVAAALGTVLFDELARAIAEDELYNVIALAELLAVLNGTIDDGDNVAQEFKGSLKKILGPLFHYVPSSASRDRCGQFGIDPDSFETILTEAFQA